jgi:hypothetical protein
MDLRKVRPLHPVLVIHATCSGLWFALLVFQSGLIQKRNTSVHRTLGFASILLALGIFIAGQCAVNYFQFGGEHRSSADERAKAGC